MVIYTGDTYYVLTKSLNSSTYWLWNPSTGECYDQHDTNCTLISIGCIFNARNVSWKVLYWHTLQICVTRYGPTSKTMKNLPECIWMLVLAVNGKHYLLPRSLLQFLLTNRLFSIITQQIQPSLQSYKIGTTYKMT